MICQIRWWKELDRWDWIRVSSLITHSRIRSHSRIHALLARRVEPFDKAKTPFTEVVPISIHFDGSISKRLLKEGREYTLPMLWVRPGDVVLSKIDLKNGAVGILPDDWAGVAVTTHFAVYEPDRKKVLPEYFRLLIQTPLFKAWLSQNKSGHDGRTEVKLADFEELEVPLRHSETNTTWLPPTSRLWTSLPNSKRKPCRSNARHNGNSKLCLV